VHDALQGILQVRARHRRPVPVQRGSDDRRAALVAEKLGGHARGFRESTLRDAVLALADADYLLKTGQAGDELLEDIIIRLCRK